MGSHSREVKNTEHFEKIKILIEILSQDADIIIKSVKTDLTPSKRFKYSVGANRIEIEADDPTAARAALHSVLRLLSLLDDAEVVLNEG